MKKVLVAPDEDLDFFEDLILAKLLRLFVIAGFFVLIPNLWVAVIRNHWAVFAVDIGVFALGIALSFAPHVAPKARSGGVIAGCYAIGITVLLAGDLYGAGYLWLLGAIGFSAVFASVPIIIATTSAAVVAVLVFVLVERVPAAGVEGKLTMVGLTSLSLVLISVALAYVIHQLITRLRRIAKAQRAVVAQLRVELDANAETSRRLERSLASQRALTRELDHRVKNTLQLAASLAGIAARAPHDRAVADLSVRIGAISEVHHNSEAPEGVSLVDVNRLLQRIAYNVHQSFDAPLVRLVFSTTPTPILVGTDTATQIAIAVTEIVTNALRHAFPHQTLTDQPEIVLATRTDETDGRFEVTIQDNGVGFPAVGPATDDPPAGGEGLLLARGLLEQVSGELRREACQNGVTYRIRAPLELAMPTF